MLAHCVRPTTKGLHIRVANSIAEVSEEWMSLSPNSPLMHVRYYRALEEALPEHMKVVYGLIYSKGQLVMVIPAQILPFNAKKSLANSLANPEKGTFWDRLKTFVAGRIHFYTLVVGNAMLTGEYAYQSNLDATYHGNLLDWGIEEIAAYLDGTGLNTSVILIKDFTPEHAQRLSCMEDRYFKFRVQPNMGIQLRPDWHEFDNYLDSMTSKYRIRTKKVLERGAQIVRKSLTLDELRQSGADLFRLYMEVAEQADFNLFLLQPNYFAALKEHFKEDFQVVSYTYKGETVGFFSYFVFLDRIEAHFLGYSLRHNKDLALYHNMLLDLFRTCFATKCGTLSLGRTALEIKSSLGAEPQDLFCLLRHRKRIHQHFVPYLFEYLRTDLDWEPRHPFREANSSGVPANQKVWQ